MVNINRLERNGLHQAVLCLRNTMMKNINSTLLPDRSQPRMTVTAPTDRHRDVGDKCDTGVTTFKKIRGRENNSIGTWNLRTLKPAGKLELLTHAMGKYQRKPEMRLKNFGEMSTDDGHKVYFLGEEGKHEYRV